jgi:hypothetical protein
LIAGPLLSIAACLGVYLVRKYLFRNARHFNDEEEVLKIDLYLAFASMMAVVALAMASSAFVFVVSALFGAH